MKKLQELKPIHDQTSETIRRSMLTLLVLAFFSLLTAFGTEDVQLLRAESSIQLPSFANAPISFIGFLVAAPFLLIVVIIYLHVFVAYGRRLEAVRWYAGKGSTATHGVLPVENCRRCLTSTPLSLVC